MTDGNSRQNKKSVNFEKASDVNFRKLRSGVAKFPLEGVQGFRENIRGNRTIGGNTLW